MPPPSFLMSGAALDGIAFSILLWCGDVSDLFMQVSTPHLKIEALRAQVAASPLGPPVDIPSCVPTGTPTSTLHGQFGCGKGKVDLVVDPVESEDEGMRSGSY